jgi:short-subunit dehydrogenase
MTTRTILLTGATDGIGLALARHYQAEGHTLLLTGRRALPDRDPALFTAASYCQADLAAPDCAPRIGAFVAHALDGQPLDLLIHNAAMGYVGSTAEQPSASTRDMLAVNLRAPVALTHALLPHMRRGSSKIVFISSVVSALACPTYAVYGASKAALEGFARSLRAELRGSTDVQVIVPGATRTGMHAKSGADPAAIKWERFPPAEQVAAQIAHAIDSPRPTATIGGSNRLLRLGGRHTAGLFDWLMRRRLA